MIPLWVDCDPGQDDVIALVLAASNPSFDLVGVSSVHGNSSLENTTRNALRFLTALGKASVPVYEGAATSIEGTTDFCPEVHGKTGLDGSDLIPEPAFAAHPREEFFPALKAAIEKYDGQLCIAAIAPLTNIYQFFEKYPSLKSKVRYLAIMGGGFNVFNRNERSEFNIVTDALAAHKVFEDSELAERILLAPLDITSTVRASIAIQDAIKGPSQFRTMMYQLTHGFHLRIKARKGPDYVGPSVHDPVALISLLQFCGEDPALKFTADKENVQVDPKNGYMTTDGPGPVTVLKDLDRDHFWKVMLDAFARADTNSGMD